MTVFFLLDGTQTSLSMPRHLGALWRVLGFEGEYGKTKAVWLGGKRFSKDILLPEKYLA